MDIMETIDNRIGELRVRFRQTGESEWRFRINELQRIRELLIITTEKDHPCYQKNPSQRIATTSRG